MATVAPKRMTLAEFLEWDDGSETHHELVRGRIVAMAPPTERHGTNVSNLGRHLGNRLTSPASTSPSPGS